MTKQESKFISGLLFLSLIAGMGTPFVSFAQAGGTTTRQDRGNFCSRISEIEAKFLQESAGREEKLSGKREERDLRITQHRADREKKRTEQRSAWDTKREEHYVKLMERASTTAQKEAVTAFQNAIESAVETRKTAIDDAVRVYRSGVDKVIADRKIAFDAVANTLKNSVNAALAKAKADCAGSVTPSQVREDFRKSIKTARDVFQEERKAVEKVSVALESLRIARKASIDKAVEDFKTAVAKAKNDLKSSF